MAPGHSLDICNATAFVIYNTRMLNWSVTSSTNL